MPGGADVVACLVCGTGFGAGTDAAQCGVGGTDPDLAKFLPGVPGSPRGLGGVGAADQPQPAVGHGTDIRSVGWAKGDERLMPGGSLVRYVAAGFGADRVIGVVIAVHFPVRGDSRRLVFPLAARAGVSGDRAESGDGPGGAGLGRVLAQADGAVIHHGRDLAEVGLPSAIGQLRDPVGPRPLRLRQQRAGALADAGVEDGGDVAGSGQVARGDGRGDAIPFETEAALLLSPLFREIGEELYEIEPDVRNLLLTGLYSRYGTERVDRVALLLEQYTEPRPPGTPSPNSSGRSS